MKPIPVAFQVSAFAMGLTSTRHFVFDRHTGDPSIAASIYEAHLANRYDSPSTRAHRLTALARLLDWSATAGLTIEEDLLTGKLLAPSRIAAFAQWMKARVGQDGSGPLPRKLRAQINGVIDGAAQAEAFFARNATPPCSSHIGSLEQTRAKLDYQRSAWQDQKSKVTSRSVAPDMSDGEIQAVEHFLRPDHRVGRVERRTAERDYLVWRMAIECGMRIGEILCVRLEDCPSRNRPYFRVVRIEEREDQSDPRHPYAPRPKTLSRDLGFILENTKFPQLVSTYISSSRYANKRINERRSRRFLLPHQFLVIGKSGSPLSQKGATAIAKEIRIGTGIDFHWHLARHAFFNRAYQSVLDQPNEDLQRARLQDLIVWGGWESESSLGIYTRRARKSRAQNSLRLWQEGGSKWTALD